MTVLAMRVSDSRNPFAQVQVLKGSIWGVLGGLEVWSRVVHILY